MNLPTHIKELWRKQLQEGLRPDEEQQLEWLLQVYDPVELNTILDELMEEIEPQQSVVEETDYTALAQAIIRADKEKRKKKQQRSINRAIAAAAVLLIIFMLGRWWSSQPVLEYACDNIDTGEIPTQNFSVYWSRGEGAAIKVDSTQMGTLLATQSLEVRQVEPGLLEFKKTKQAPLETTEHIIRTKSQQQYRLKLMDGTLIRMNANTTIRFPDRLEGDKHKLYIEGEAYIQLPAGQQFPLFIQTQQASYIVTGGKLNISTYGNIGKLYREEGATVQVLTSLNRRTEVNTHQLIQVMQYKPSGIAKTFNDSIGFISDIDPEDILYWKNKQRDYYNKPLIQYVYDLCNWYGLEFKDLACVKKIQINASICYNASVFESIAIVREYDRRVTLHQNQLSFCDPGNHRGSSLAAGAGKEGVLVKNEPTR